MNYNGLNTSSKKGVETIMKTTISLYGKGNEVVSWCMIMFYSKQQLLLYVMSWMMHVAPYLGKSNEL
jgi:hypothetical protein